jgi:hypothetical protein
MKKLAILMLLALELAVCGCGSRTLANTNKNTASTASWEAQLVGGTGPASQLNFLTTFNVQTYNNISVPLDIPSSGFNFFNAGECFSTGFNVVTVTGSAAFATTTGTDQVTGQLSMVVTSLAPAGNVLTLTAPPGGLTGTSNGTTTTTGTLSNGVVVGTWSLTGGAGSPSCTGSGTFIMCEGTSTCTPP